MTQYRVVKKWVWQCTESNQACQRTFSTDQIQNNVYSSIDLCKLVCGSNGNIWPLPSVYSPTDKTLIRVDISDAKFHISANNATVEFVNGIVDYFKDSVESASGKCTEYCYSVTVNLKVKSSSLVLNWDTDEEYVLTSTTNDVSKQTEINITGTTVFGVRHGLETLLQLFVLDENYLVTIKSYQINDKPFYKHRGLLLDSARNFLSINVIKRNIIAMGMSKMNVLHWHLSDSQSFPFVSSRLPNMSRYGAYSEQKMYQPEDIADLIKFAKLRGVLIIPEIDGPAHVGSGWQWGPEAGLGNLVVCYNQQPWKSYCIQPPCGQLNPANSKIYDVLTQIYSDIRDLWNDLDIFHMGGDEVYIPCWNSSQDILDYIGTGDRSEKRFLDLWSEYQSKALSAFDGVTKNNSTSVILWTSSLTAFDLIKNYLPAERYVIQTWVPTTDILPELLILLGYKIIVSTKDKWYLDHGFWGTTEYYRWREVYDNKILTADAVLGGEVCMWGELVNDNNVEARVWPRAAAAAERLWSNLDTTSIQAQGRFFVHNGRMERRGIKTSAVVPEFCAQNDDDCSGYLSFNTLF